MNKILFSSVKFAKYFFLNKIKWDYLFYESIIMQKRRLIIAYTLIISWCYVLNFCTALMGLGDKTTIYNTGQEYAIAPIPQDPETEGSILHMWSRRIFWQWDITYWLVWTDQAIDDYNIALTKILTVIQNVVNRALWILWLIALIYLIIHWFMILTAAGDDSKQKKWLKWVKLAFIALAWIWLSWIIVSFILWLINILSA